MATSRSWPRVVPALQTAHRPAAGSAIGAGPQGPDFNPELIVLDSDRLPTAGRFPAVQTGDRLRAPVLGIVDYAFQRNRILPDAPVTFLDRAAAGTRQPSRSG